MKQEDFRQRQASRRTWLGELQAVVELLRPRDPRRSNNFDRDLTKVRNTIGRLTPGRRPEANYEVNLDLALDEVAAYLTMRAAKHGLTMPKDDDSFPKRQAKRYIRLSPQLVPGYMSPEIYGEAHQRFNRGAIAVAQDLVDELVELYKPDGIPLKQERAFTEKVEAQMTRIDQIMAAFEPEPSPLTDEQIKEIITTPDLGI